MALHIKSNRSFLLVIGASAFAISIMAALFSITGVSSLFSGELRTIVFMMAVLELAKIVLASYLATYWNKLTGLIRAYFIIAVLVLMTITSAGIFGYLSDAYQGTKGNYEQVDQSIKTERIRENFYKKEMTENESRIAELRGMKRTYQLQIDSLIARNKSTYSVERALTYGDKEITEVRKKNTSLNDSLSAIQLRIAEKEGVNSSGKLGPLRYMADVFGTSMDNIVKYFILVLIFVFDPLAVLLFVSMAIIIRKDKEMVQEPKKPVTFGGKTKEELLDNMKNLLNSKTSEIIDDSGKKLVDPKTGEYTLKFNDSDYIRETLESGDIWIPPPGVELTRENRKKFDDFIAQLKNDTAISASAEIPTGSAEPYTFRRVNMDAPTEEAKIPESEPEVKKKRFAKLLSYLKL